MTRRTANALASGSSFATPPATTSRPPATLPSRRVLTAQSRVSTSLWDGGELRRALLSPASLRCWRSWHLRRGRTSAEPRALKNRVHRKRRQPSARLSPRPSPSRRPPLRHRRRPAPQQRPCSLPTPLNDVRFVTCAGPTGWRAGLAGSRNCRTGTDRHQRRRRVRDLRMAPRPRHLAGAPDPELLRDPQWHRHRRRCVPRLIRPTWHRGCEGLEVRRRSGQVGAVGIATGWP